MKATMENTRIFKSHHLGWKAETIVKTPGNQKDYKISTSKYNGFLDSDAHQCNVGNGGGMISFELFADKNIRLIRTETRATENTVTTQHAQALKIFNQKVEAGEIQIKSEEEAKEDDIKKGQIIFTDGLNYDTNRRAIFEIKDGNFGPEYKAVNLETLEITHESRIKPFSQKFGIGTYYNPGDTIDIETLDSLVIQAKEKAIKDQAAKEEQKRKDAEETARKIEEGKELVQVPGWAKAVILANLKEDDSDPYTDYFSHHTVKTIYLAFSRHDRDLFPEMKKAVLRCEETKHLAEAKENREKYSMGSGYYLGDGHHSGWEARKANFQSTYGVQLNDLYIAAAEGRYFANVTEDQETGPDQAESLKNGDIELIHYSDKAVAIFGDTKPIKDTLKSLGGRFNFRLTHPETGAKSCGWIFPATKEPDLRAQLF